MPVQSPKPKTLIGVNVFVKAPTQTTNTNTNGYTRAASEHVCPLGGGPIPKPTFDGFRMALQISEAISSLNDCVAPLIYESDLTSEDIIIRVSSIVSDLYNLRDYVTANDPIYTLKPHSGDIRNSGVVAEVQDQENVEFHSEEPDQAQIVETFMDPLRTIADDQMSLDNFFRRPIIVDEFTWPIGGVASHTIQPWLIYMANPRVINRLNNYKLLTCKMKIKTIINGSPFHYGRSMMSYLPKKQYDDFGVVTSTTGQDAFVELSQRPHYFINPTDNTGGEMELPFFHEQNYIDFASLQFSDMGQLTWFEINSLQHANGATEGVTVTTFAWMEDVKFSIPTSVDNIALIPQMSSNSRKSKENETDQANDKGFISAPATAMADIVSKFKSVPVISPYALATETALRGGAAVARLFGYSKPVMTSAPNRMRPQPISDMATCTVPDTCAKLSVDDKQELSIDPRLSGIGPEDPLNIRYIASHESYLDTFTWSTSDAANKLLWNSRVTPMLYRLNGTKLNMTPMCYAATPFTFWTGTIKFRFQIVCSKVHKGRFRAVFDPTFFQTVEYNVNCMKIVDITEETDFTVEIGVAQSRTLIRTCVAGSIAHDNFYKSTGGFSSTNLFSNGVVAIYVVNELATPAVGSQDISVNVYVSAGDDFECFAPSNYILPYTLRPQMSFVTRAKDQSDKPEHTTSTTLCTGSTNHDLVNKIYCGEAIGSLRLLAKRYNLHEAIVWGENGSINVYAGRRNAFPYYRGNVGTTVHTTAALQDYNYCNTVMLHWITMAFAGQRGSIRYKIVPQGQSQAATIESIYIERVNPQYAQYQSVRNLQTSWTTPSQAAWSSVGLVDYSNLIAPTTGQGGMAFAYEKVNPCIEFEIPYYSNNRFQPGRPDDYVSPPIESYGGFAYRIFAGTNDKTNFQSFVAAGEDFQVFFFVGVPSLYYDPTPPAP